MTESKKFPHPILITGGAGFLGSHMVALCLEKKVDIIVIDNLSNSNLLNLKKLESYFNFTIPFYNIDIRDSKKLNFFFKEHKFIAVIHFAGLKSVSESFANPNLYYENNVIGSINLINCIKKYGIKKVIFSSSATVYGDPKYLPIDEVHPVQPLNPYAESKVKVEQIFLQDKYFKISSVKLLRYFNPIGSYKGIIGEKPKGVPNNLMPYILGVAKKEYEYLNIYGGDYDTLDGTGVRDYIHVMDLIDAHWLALLNDTQGCEIFNVGCGKGFSVKQITKTFEEVNKINIPYQIRPRRVGDISTSYAKVNKIKNKLNWSAQYTLRDMCRDSWIVNAL